MISIKVNISKQLLSLFDEHQELIAEYPVSTSKYGIGNKNGSFQTPLGHHQICDMIGDNMPADEVYIGREAKGQLSDLRAQGSELPEDIITARILRLAGVEQGVNRGEGIDSFDRYIYIHGTADEANISHPASHGCVRMLNNDIIELYKKVELNTDVWIED
jgi:L,D-transpeptidase catalytic domain